MSRVLDIVELCATLGLTPGEFDLRWPYLRRVGFPRHLPGLGMRWSRAQVEAWIDAGGVPAPPPEPPAATGLRLVVDNDHALLTERYVENL